MLQEDFGAAKTLSYFLGEESPSAKVQLCSHAHARPAQLDLVEKCAHARYACARWRVCVHVFVCVDAA